MMKAKLNRENKAFKQVKSKDTKNKELEFGLEIEAKSYVELTLGKEFGKSDKFGADFYFSGVTISVRVKMGMKGKSGAFPIVPDFDKKFDVMKNKGEYK